MVLSGGRDYLATAATVAATTTPEKTETVSAPTRRRRKLHNFTLPSLKWGNQRHFTCVKRLPGDGGGSGDGGGGGVGGGSGGGEEGIKEFRMKIMSDLKTVRDKMTQSMLKKDFGSGSGSGSGQEKDIEELEVSPTKPWTLRKRKPACIPISGTEPANAVLENKETIVYNHPSPKKVAEIVTEKRKKFSLKLSKKEIREDYKEILGRKTPRRPKKRSKAVQKKLDSITPGLYLREVTVDSYKV